MSFLSGSQVLVTGGGGFLGRFLCPELARYGPAEVRAPRRAECDLLDPRAVRSLLQDVRPDVVIHLAAVVGGIGANRRHPGRFFYENAAMGIHLMEEARQAGVAKFVLVGTVCAYPKHTQVPFREEAIWDGYPEETNAPYGIAKKMLMVQAQAYRQEYGFNAITLLPANLYGPGDNFDPSSSHVIPALIRKAVEARDADEDHIDVWGTGTASREFLYVQDAAEGIARAADGYDKPEPVNLGTGREVAIRELVGAICRACDFRGEVRWDATKPDGQPRRCLDTARAREEFGFTARTPLADGLARTVAWYEHERNGRPARPRSAPLAEVGHP
jgi:GDP-L-fucose synthase